MSGLLRGQCRSSQCSIVGAGELTCDQVIRKLQTLCCHSVPDLNQAVPETELLDNSIQKGRAQLSVKARRHRPSRSRYRDSVSSTEGDDSLERRVRSRLMDERMTVDLRFYHLKPNRH